MKFKWIQDHNESSIESEFNDCMTSRDLQNFLPSQVDNISANDNATDLSRTNVRANKTIICDCQFIHVRCFAHIINFIVSKILKQVDE